MILKRAVSVRMKKEYVEEKGTNCQLGNKRKRGKILLFYVNKIVISLIAAIINAKTKTKCKILLSYELFSGIYVIICADSADF